MDHSLVLMLQDDEISFIISGSGSYGNFISALLGLQDIDCKVRKGNFIQLFVKCLNFAPFRMQEYLFHEF